MKRVYGNKDVRLVECINPRKKIYRVRYDVQPYTNEETHEDGVSYYEIEFRYRPSSEQIKEAVIDGYNSLVDEKILSGFVWQGMPVWLSTENQFNYKAAYDLAVQTNGATLPTVFKFGDTESPVYYKFDTLDDLHDFYTKAMTYINEQLAIGWHKKDSIDWSAYEKALKQPSGKLKLNL